jgi:hypothetical protein
MIYIKGTSVSPSLDKLSSIFLKGNKWKIQMLDSLGEKEFSFGTKEISSGVLLYTNFVIGVDPKTTSTKTVKFLGSIYTNQTGDVMNHIAPYQDININIESWEWK